MKIADLFFRVRLEGVNQVSVDLNNLGNKFSKVGNTMKSVASTLTKSVTLPLLAIAGAAVYTTVTFDKQMSRVASVTGETGEGFDTLRELAQEMGRTTSKSATDAAKAMEYMGLAGWDLGQIQEGILPILRASEAGMMDLGVTSDLVTDSMSALGIGTEDLTRYLDIAANAQNNSNQSMQQFLEAMVTAGGTFKMFNIPLEEAGALLGILANRGYKGAEAGNALISIMANLTTGTGQAGDAMKDLGIEVYDSDGKFRGMTVILDELNDKFADMTEEQKNTYIQMIAGKVRTKEFTAMLNGANKELGSLTNTLYDSNGALNEMAKVMQNNVAGQLTRLKSALEGIAIQIGDKLTPIISWLADRLQFLANWFYNLSEKTKTMVLVFGGIIAVIPIIIGAFGTLTIITGAFITSLGIIAGLVTSLISGLGLLLIPIGLVGAAFAALSAVIITVGLGNLYNKFGSLNAIMLAFKEFIYTSVVPALQYLSSGEGLGKVTNAAFITKDRLVGIRNAMLGIKNFIMESLVPALIFLATGEGLEKVQGASKQTQKVLQGIRDKMVQIYNFIMDSLVPSLIYLATGEGLGKVEEAGTDLKTNLINLRTQLVSIRNYIMGTLVPALVYLATGKGLGKVKGASKDTKEALSSLRKNLVKLMDMIDSFDGSQMVNQLSNIVGAISGLITWANKAINAIKQLGKTGSPDKVKLNLDGHAQGIKNSPNDHWAIVGEEGAELMHVKKGTSIYSHEDSKKMLAGGSKTSVSNNNSSLTTNAQTFNFNGNLLIDPTKIKDIEDIIKLFTNIKQYQSLNI